MIRTTTLAALTLALMSATRAGPAAPMRPMRRRRSCPAPMADYPPDARRPQGAAAATQQAARPASDSRMRRRAICSAAAMPRRAPAISRRARRPAMNRPAAPSAARWAARRWAPSSAAPPAMPARAPPIGAGAGLIAGTADRCRQCPPRGQRCRSATMPTPIMPAWTRPNDDAADAAYALWPAAAWAIRLWPPTAAGAYPPPAPYYYGAYPYPYPYYYGPAVTFGFGFGGYHGWHGGGVAWRPLAPLGRSDCFCRRRPGCMVRPFSFSGSAMPPKAQSRQAQSAAAAHPDPAAGDRAHSRRRQPAAERRCRHHPVSPRPWRSFPSGRCHRGQPRRHRPGKPGGVERADPQGHDQGGMAASDRADAGRPGL